MSARSFTAFAVTAIAISLPPSLFAGPLTLYSLTSGGETRNYRVSIPPGYDPAVAASAVKRLADISTFLCGIAD